MSCNSQYNNNHMTVLFYELKIYIKNGNEEINTFFKSDLKRLRIISMLKTALSAMFSWSVKVVKWITKKTPIFPFFSYL